MKEQITYDTFEKVDISLGEDLFFITGLNKDENLSESNGAGKSFVISVAVTLHHHTIQVLSYQP